MRSFFFSALVTRFIPLQKFLKSRLRLFFQNDMINVGGELGSGDAGYFSTSPQMAYQPATTTTTATQQLTPQTPNTPTIILTGIIPHGYIYVPWIFLIRRPRDKTWNVSFVLSIILGKSLRFFFFFFTIIFQSQFFIH